MKDETIKEIYEYITKYIKDNNYSPTYEQICVDLGYSMGTVYNAITYLIENDYINRPKWGVMLITEKEYEDD